MAKATDADLTARVPETTSIALTVRTTALDDAAAMINLSAFGDKAVRAHAMYAAHILAKLDPDTMGAGATPQVASMNAGSISVSYAAPVAAQGSDSDLGSTRWGRAYLSIAATVAHVGEAV